MTYETEPADSTSWLDDWSEWLKDDLFQQVHQLVQQREVFKSWNEIVDVAAPESKTRGLFHAWVNHNYVTSLAVGVRRMCDQDTRTRSLVRLLSEIEENAAELTRDWWAGRWWPEGDDPPDRYLDGFNELSSGGDHVDPAVVRADLEKLADACKVVKGYVDKHVAHIDGDRQSLGPVTLGDVHTAADTVYEVFHRWYQLVTNTVLTVALVEPWEHGFTVPWITDDEASEIIARREAESKVLENRLCRGP